MVRTEKLFYMSGVKNHTGQYHRLLLSLPAGITAGQLALGSLIGGWYHYTGVPSLAGLAAIFTIAITAFVINYILWGSKNSVFLAKVILVLCPVWLFYPILSGYFDFPSFGGYEKSLVVGLFVIAVVAIVNFIPHDLWNRLAISVTFTLFLFVSMPFTPLFKLLAPEYETLDFSELGEVHQSKVVMVLDELSPEGAQKIITRLVSEGFWVGNTSVPAAAQTTLEAIPAMLTGELDRRVLPCSFSALCGLSVKDFQNFYVNENDYDVVGYWHAYCDIKGLRSCFRLIRHQSQPFLSTLKYAGCYLDRGIFTQYLTSCEAKSDSMYKFAWPDVAKEVDSAIFNAPFWNVGGNLFVHIPLPHPIFDVASESSLKAEYKKNVFVAEQLVVKLAEELKNRFDNNFSLTILSDHSLRAELIWCTHDAYSHQGLQDCLLDNEKNRGLVPLIRVALSKQQNFIEPQTAIGIFAKN